VSGEGRLPLPLAGADMNLPRHLQAAARWLRLLTVGAAAGRGARPWGLRWELGRRVGTDLEPHTLCSASGRGTSMLLLPRRGLRRAAAAACAAGGTDSAAAAIMHCTVHARANWGPAAAAAYCTGAAGMPIDWLGVAGRLGVCALQSGQVLALPQAAAAARGPRTTTAGKYNDKKSRRVAYWNGRGGFLNDQPLTVGANNAAEEPDSVCCRR
jgi:hypothetical protein